MCWQEDKQEVLHFLWDKAGMLGEGHTRAEGPGMGYRNQQPSPEEAVPRAHKGLGFGVLDSSPLLLTSYVNLGKLSMSQSLSFFHL